MHWAAFKDAVKALAVLVEAGADLDKPDKVRQALSSHNTAGAGEISPSLAQHSGVGARNGCG